MPAIDLEDSFPTGAKFIFSVTIDITIDSLASDGTREKLEKEIR